MKYRVRHKTVYSYGETVDLAAHMLHLRPREMPYQRVLDASLSSDPEPATQSHSLDHFGNRVTRFFIDAPHVTFEIEAEAAIDVCFPDPPPPSETPAWETVAAAAAAGGLHHAAAEFQFASPLIPILPETRAYAARSFPPGRPILAGLLDLNGRINRDFTYRSGVTTIGTPIARVMHKREGVCQDFAHLMISALRGLGLPARYVSGYLRTHPAPGQPHLRGADQSHAWIAAWIGPEHGWIDFDPTNDLVVKDEHVVLAWGRDFIDVSPVRGVILGGGKHALSVSVDLAPL